MALNTTSPATRQIKRSNKGVYLGVVILVIVAFILMYSNRATSEIQNSGATTESTTDSMHPNNTNVKNKDKIKRQKQIDSTNTFPNNTDASAGQTSGLTTSDPDPQRGKSPKNRNRKSDTMNRNSNQNQSPHSDSEMNQNTPNRD